MLVPSSSACAGTAPDAVPSAGEDERDAEALLDALMRLAARHFGVAAACVMPGEPQRRWIGAGLDAPLREALRKLHHVALAGGPLAGSHDRPCGERPGEPDDAAAAATPGRPRPGPLVMADAQAHPLWRACLAQASALPLRFAAVWPLAAADGEAAASLCLIDSAPRELSGTERESLDDFARVAAALVSRSAGAACPSDGIDALRARERLLALAIAGSGTGIWDRNVVTGEIHYSSGWKAMLGYADDEVTNRIEDSYGRLHPDDLAYVKATMDAHFAGRTESYEVEHRIRCKDGSYKWICSRGKVVSRDGAGRALRMIGTTTDITAMRAMAERLRETVELVTNLTNEVPGLVFQYRLLRDGRSFFSYASAGLAEIYELLPEQVATSAACLDALIHPDDRDAYRASLEASAATLTPWRLEYRVQLPRQGLRWRQGDAKPQRLADGTTVWHGFITDVTERKGIEAELQEFATTDSLTHLANRRHFMGRLEAQLALLRRGGGPSAAVVMCDLDHFKSINDRWGHATGDEALRYFAAILRTHLRAGDVAGRIGGEEFAILLAGTDVGGAHSVARRIQARLAGEPLVADGRTLPLTVSIGISALGAGDASVEAVLSRSDGALYRAKKGGRNRIESQ